jgi:hypothetical protein
VFLATNLCVWIDKLFSCGSASFRFGLQVHLVISRFSNKCLMNGEVTLNEKCPKPGSERASGRKRRIFVRQKFLRKFSSNIFDGDRSLTTEKLFSFVSKFVRRLRSLNICSNKFCTRLFLTTICCNKTCHICMYS